MRESAQPPLQFPHTKCISLLPRHPSSRHCLPPVGRLWFYSPLFHLLCFVMISINIECGAIRVIESIYNGFLYSRLSRFQSTDIRNCVSFVFGQSWTRNYSNWMEIDEQRTKVPMGWAHHCFIFPYFRNSLAQCVCVCAIRERCNSDMYRCWIILFIFQNEIVTIYFNSFINFNWMHIAHETKLSYRFPNYHWLSFTD